MTTPSGNTSNTQPPETFQNWWNRGYGSSIIPVHFGKKAPAILAWQHFHAVEADIKRWDSKKYNIGLQTAKFPCLDIDCSHLNIVKEIHTAVKQTWQGTDIPLRFRGYPRCAILFKLAPDAPSMLKTARTYFHPVTGETFTLEMLGDGQQVVIDGKHPSDEWYRWVQKRPAVDELPVIDQLGFTNMFSQIDKRLAVGGYRPKRPRVTVRSAKTSKYGPTPPKGHEHLVVEILKVLPNEGGYDDWIDTGMAAKAAAGKSVGFGIEYFQAWDEWSAKSPQNEAKKTNDDTWLSFDPDGSVGYGTLVYLLKQTEGNDALKSRIDRARIPDAKTEFSVVDEADPFVEALSTDIWTAFVTNVPSWMKDMNDRIALLSTGTEALFIMEPNVKRDKPDLKRKGAAEILTANWPPIPNKNSKLKAIPRLKAFLEHPLRRPPYRGLDIYVDKMAPPDIFNMWHGWPYENEKPGSWNLLKWHIDNIICGGDRVLQAYVYNWMAHGVQHAMTPSRVALMLQGEQGTGKGAAIQAYLKLFGRAHVLHLGSSQMITGTFNGLLKNKLVVFADEAFFADDPRQARHLKTIITEDTIIFNEKFEPAYEAPNRMNLIMATNDIHAVQLDTGDRRYAVVEIENTKANDHAYFTSLFQSLDVRSVMAGFFHFLRERDISKFVPSDLPPTSARANQILMSLTPVKAWWYEALNSDGPCPGSHPPDVDWDVPVVQIRPHAYSHFQNWARQANVKHVPSAQKFGIELAQISARIGGPTTALGQNAHKLLSRVNNRNKFEKVCKCKLSWT